MTAFNDFNDLSVIFKDFNDLVFSCTFYSHGVVGGAVTIELYITWQLRKKAVKLLSRLRSN